MGDRMAAAPDIFPSVLRNIPVRPRLNIR